MQTACIDNRAGFWPRLAAFALDRLLLAVALLAVRLPGLFSSGGFYNRAVLFSFTAMDILCWALISAYFVVLTACGGATLGKRAMGLQVVRGEDGEKPGFLTVLCRETAGRYLSSILYVGYFLIAIDSDRRGLHDRLFDTRVVYARRSATPAASAPDCPTGERSIVPVADPVKDWYEPYRK